MRRSPLTILFVMVPLLAVQAPPTPLRFEVSLAPGLMPTSSDGRLFVVVSRTASPEPRLSIGRTGLDASPVFAHDVSSLSGDASAVIDGTSASFPVASLSALPPDDYFVQALFDTNIDLKSVNAPGNLYSGVQKLTLDPARSGRVTLQLTQKVPPEELPPDAELVRFVKIQSKLLSDFHRRPIYLRAGIVLPRGYDPSRTYPLRVHIGGYGERFTTVQRLMSDGSAFHEAWMADAAPRMILVQLDGDGPYGDPYQVNSANGGPYGDAVTQELIPHVERTFHAVGAPAARALDGGSTGGWVSLALQVFYPDFFNGAWSSCPDSVDFRAFQLIDIYQDRNAYVNAFGFERPSEREENGDVRFTMRHELQMENMMGLGDNWAMSGQQWGAWNATYSLRGVDGRPVPLWDPKTGEIHRDVAEQWKKYDVRLVLERQWPMLAPKLRGKIHIWVGEADNYFLNNAVHLLDHFLSNAQPSAESSFAYGPGRGHCWVGLNERQLMDAMAAATGASR